MRRMARAIIGRHISAHETLRRSQFTSKEFPLLVNNPAMCCSMGTEWREYVNKGLDINAYKCTTSFLEGVDLMAWVDSLFLGFKVVQVCGESIRNAFLTNSCWISSSQRLKEKKKCDYAS